MTKDREAFSIRIRTEVARQMKTLAKARGISRQRLIERTLIDAFEEGRQEDRDAFIARRLTQMDNRLRVFEREIEVIAESLALFLRMWLVNSPEVPQDQRETALREANDRYERFVNSLIARVSSGQTILTELPREVMLRASDFLGKAEPRNDD